MRRIIASVFAILMAISPFIAIIATNTTQVDEPIVEVTEPIIEDTELMVEVTEPVVEITEPIVEIIEPQPWWTEEELDILAATIYYEAGSNECTDRHQQLVAQVVLNRVNSEYYPDTIRSVVTQSGQYSTRKLILKNMGTSKIPQRCYDNALVALNGKVDCPSNVVYQANFKQGKGVYEKIHTSYSTSYFCYR